MEIKETIVKEHLNNLVESCEGLFGKSEKFLMTRNKWSGDKIAYLQICKMIDEVVNEYNWLVPKINFFLNQVGIKSLLGEASQINTSWEKLEDNKYSLTDDVLIKIKLSCKRTLAILNNLATETKETKNKFDSLKEEIEDLKKEGIDKKTTRNLEEAMSVFELNKLLSTTLICGRVAIFYLDSIKGNINEKIEKMVEGGLLVGKGSKDYVLKANQKLRGLFAHDINFFPSAAETLSIFGDTIYIVKAINKYHKINNLENERGNKPESPPKIP